MICGKKFMLVAVTAAIAINVAPVSAKTLAISASSRGLGIFIGAGRAEHRVIVEKRAPIVAPHTRVVERHVSLITPRHRHYHRFHIIRPRPVIVPGPHRHHVVLPPRPPVIVAPQPVICESTVVNVWITNSNGSRTAVRLTRNGSGYVGPRGEYYCSMPTNEQLRVVYGF